MITVKEHIQPGFVSHHERLDDQIYGAVLDSCVLMCVDVVIYRKAKLFMGRRTQYPAKGQMWVPGGRMMPGETFAEAAGRITLRELRAHVDHKRFECMGLKNYVWLEREQPPQDNGCHMVGLYMGLELLESELVPFVTRSDFSDARWIKISEVATNQDGTYHPAMENLAHQLLSS